MADYDLIVRNGRIVTEDRQLEGDIGVKDGRIAAVEPGLKGITTRELDAGGNFVLPGGIDHRRHHLGRKTWAAEDGAPSIAACSCARSCRTITRRRRPRPSSITPSI